MTDKLKPPPAPDICNPHYEGATPEMVGRALVRHQEPLPKNEDQAETGA